MMQKIITEQLQEVDKLKESRLEKSSRLDEKQLECAIIEDEIAAHDVLIDRKIKTIEEAQKRLEQAK